VNFVRRLLYVIVALIGLGLAVGLFLPDSAHVERAITTSASPSTVYAIVSGFKRFNEWSPWYELDPQAKYAYSGPESGVGAKMTWASDKPDVGSGSQEIVSVEPGRAVKTRLEFGGQGPSMATLTITPESGGSRIVWAFDTSFEGNYLGRYMGLMFEKFIGRDYEKGLSKLKTIAEATPAAP
jgi:hypothetical protein